MKALRIKRWGKRRLLGFLYQPGVVFFRRDVMPENGPDIEMHQPCTLVSLLAEFSLVAVRYDGSLFTRGGGPVLMTAPVIEKRVDP